MNTSNGYEEQLDAHVKRERAAVKLASKTGQLLYDKGVELVLFRNHLANMTVSEIMNSHEYSRKVVQKPIDVFTTSDMAEVILSMDLAPSKLDVGLLAHEYIAAKDKYEDMLAFLEDTLKDFIGQDKYQMEPRDVVLYGFGRIGRLAARELIKQAGKGQQLRLRAIVTRDVSMISLKNVQLYSKTIQFTELLMEL